MASVLIAWLICAMPLQAGETIRIGASTGVSSALLWIAQYISAYEKNGLDVELVPFQAGKLAVAALERGEVDFANGADFVLVKKSFAANDLRVVSQLSVNSISGIVARRDRGIESVRDLRGRRIGVTIGSSAEFFLSRVLQAEGIGTDAVFLVPAKPKALPRLLRSGAVDAVSTWDPHVYNSARALAERGIVFKAQAAHRFHFLLLSNHSWLRAHPQVTQRIIQALTEAKAAVDGPGGAELLTELFRRSFRYDRKYAQYILTRMQTVVGLSQPLLNELENQARWLAASRKDAPRIPDFRDYFYFDALDSVAPEAVTVARR